MTVTDPTDPAPRKATVPSCPAPDRYAWEACIRGADVSITERAIGHTMAGYGNMHGQRIFPGVDRLMADTGASRSVVLRALKGLENKKWIKRVKRGCRNGGASEYALSVPLEHMHKAPKRSTPTAAKPSGTRRPFAGTKNQPQERVIAFPWEKARVPSAPF